MNKTIERNKRLSNQIHEWFGFQEKDFSRTMMSSIRFNILTFFTMPLTNVSVLLMTRKCSLESTVNSFCQTKALIKEKPHHKPFLQYEVHCKRKRETKLKNNSNIQKKGYFPQKRYGYDT
jgi:hypothetical protein